MDTPTLSVIIPNWNGAAHLPTCLASLRAQTAEAAVLEVIIVDNASTDGSAALVARDFPEVRWIALPENRGFTGACNAGLRAAHGTLLALLNNDTEADPNWARAVIDAFQRHGEVGIVASKMLLFDRRDHFHTAGDFFGTDGWPGNRGAWQRDEGQFEREEYVFSACGGAPIDRRALLDEVGLLDDDFFFSMEDIDLAWRAQLVGWKCLYVPGAVVYHKLSATGGGVTASFYDGRNALFVLTKNLPAPLWRKYARRIVRRQASEAYRALRAWRGEAARARLRGMWAGLRGLPRMLRKRRAVQAMRRVAVSEIDAALTR
jgi:GT2 family glycosyltransferase